MMNAIAAVPSWFYLAVAGSFLVYLFWRRGWLLARARGGATLEYFGENIRLRDMFRLAALLEDEGNAFYLGMAAKAANPEARGLCETLAAEELAHKSFIEAQLAEWRPLPPNLKEWPVLLEKVRKAGLFGHPPGPEAGERELAAFAIRQEIKMAEFYQLFETAFPYAWKRAAMHKLVLEERKHEARLRAAYPDAG
jgi:rubrerythrin